jgi:hypothetical protein
VTRTAALALVLLLAGCGGGGLRPAAGPAGDGADPPSLLALADSALAAGEPVRARALYERALTASSRAGDAVHRARATVGMGRYYAAARRYRDARVEFERAATLDTTRAAPFYFLARAYLDAGEESQAIRALVLGLRREPGEARSLEALRPLTRSRCEAVGVPPEFAELSSRTGVTRGELGVMLAVMLGLDPGREVWSSDRPPPAIPPEADAAWGARWLRAAVMQGLLTSFPDGTLRLDDPVSRGLFALLVARAERSLTAPKDPAGSGGPDDGGGAEELHVTLPDLGPRHYLRRAAQRAVQLGLPTHSGGTFDPQAAASGEDVLRVLDRLAAGAGRTPVLPAELREALVVQ